jgi:hypothetical protein
MHHHDWSASGAEKIRLGPVKVVVLSVKDEDYLALSKYRSSNASIYPASLCCRAT